MIKVNKLFKKYNIEINILDENNNKIYCENSNGFWIKYEYDENNNEIYYENSNNYWIKREFNENNNVMYYESSIRGITLDKRKKTIKELTMKDLEKELGYKVKIVK